MQNLGDIYEGFDDPKTTQFQHPTSSYSRPRMVTASNRFMDQQQPVVIIPGTSSGSRLMTSSNTASNPGARPMTSSKLGAGYSRAGGDRGNILNPNFDPLHQAAKSAAVAKPEKTPEQKRREEETRINKLLDECYTAYGEKNYALALDRAKEAAKRERILTKETEKSSNPSLALGNPDLTFCVLFALGNMYQANQFYNDALNTFNTIVRDKQFHLSGRLRVNMGNVYFEQQRYSEAIKMYRMALDQLGTINQKLRCRILKNIGVACLKMGQLHDAVTAFENICEIKPSHDVLFNMIVCAYALKDEEEMKKLFQRLALLAISPIDPKFDHDLVAVKSVIEDQDEANPLHQDDLRELAKTMQHDVEKFIVTAARLIAPEIGNSFHEGFEWAAEVVRGSPFSHLGTDIDNAKALYLIKIKEIDEAIKLLKEFEKRGSERFAASATNLSALLIGQGEYEQAERYADLASKADRFNTKALNNKAACLFKKGDVQMAKSLLSDVISIDSLSFEGLYNMALVYMSMENQVDALKLFEKLHNLDRHDAEVIYHIADTYERMGDLQQAMEWLHRVIPITPTDPDILIALAKLNAKLGDKAQAFHYYTEAFRYYPDNLDLLTWLSAYFVESEMYERAVECFYRASLLQPFEIKWQLMIASCLRRSGNYQQSLDRYKKIHDRYPDSADCLRFLARLCSDMGLPEAHSYNDKLVELERKTRNNNNQVGIADDSIFAADTPSKLPGSSISVSSDQVKQQPSQSAAPTIQPNITPKPFATQEIHWDENVDDILPG